MSFASLASELPEHANDVTTPDWEPRIEMLVSVT